MLPTYIRNKLVGSRASYLLASGFLLLIIFALLSSPQNAYAVDVTLAWDANSEGDLAGYRIFYREDGQSYDYGNPAWEGTDTTCTISNLDNNTTYNFVARAFDTSGNESGDSEEVSFTGVDAPNQAPTADAGDNQTVDMGATVTLDGSNSYDPDGSVISYTWTQTGGTTVTLSDAATIQSTFIAPDVGQGGGTLTFQLTVADDGGLESTDTCTVYVSWVDESPTLLDLFLDGPSSINENAMAQFTATAEFSDGNIETVTQAANWSEDSSYATIGTDGALSTSEVTFDETVTITVSYTYDNITETAHRVVTIVDVPESNLAPWKPVVLSPYDGQIGLPLQPIIGTESFSDPDGDLHHQTQWQLSTHQDFALLTLDITTADHLTELTVPHAMLEGDMTYYVRARFYDTYGLASAWSDLVEFTTTTDLEDLDGNSVPDHQEVDYYTDINQDGIYDSEQPEIITCARCPSNNLTVGISCVSDSVTAIERLETIDPLDVFVNQFMQFIVGQRVITPSSLTFGLFAYRIRVDAPGAEATMKIYFSRNISSTAVFCKYDTVSGWHDYSEHTTFNDDGRSITLEVKDGGYGDSDGVANGVILDPGALVETSSSSVTDSPSGGDTNNDTPCFVTIAARNSNSSVESREMVTWYDRVAYLAATSLLGISYVLMDAFGLIGVVAGLLLAVFGLTFCCGSVMRN